MQLTHRNKTILCGVMAATAIGALAALAFLYRTRLRLGLHLLVDETGSKSIAVVCLILGAFVLASLGLWMISPILVYFGLRDLNRRTAALQETTQLCARHLAELAGPSDGPGNIASSKPR